MIRAIVVAATAAIFHCAGASAQSGYPSQTIRFVVPLAPGGVADILARVIGEKVSASLRAPVVVENRPGAGGLLAFEVVTRSAPDGHTLLIATTGLPLLQFEHKAFAGDVVKDLTPIALFVFGPVVFAVAQAVPAKTPQEFLAYAKANPGKLNYAGVGLIDVFGNELLKSMVGIRTETIRYKGGAPAALGLGTGESHYGINSYVTVKSFADSGKLRVLATTGLKRSPTLPELPTIAETIAPGFELSIWFGLAGPAGLSRDVVTRLQSAVAEALKQPDVRTRVAGLGYELAESGSEPLVRMIAGDLAKWRKVVELTGIKPE